VKGTHTGSSSVQALPAMVETGLCSLPAPGFWRHQAIHPTDILDSNLK
jgi:hypothetical protein